MSRYNIHIKLKLKAYFMRRLDAHEYNHGWLKMKCPFCGREGKFGVHIGTSKTNCFRCGGHGSPFDVIMDVEDLNSYTEVIQYLEKQIDSDGFIYKEETVKLKSISEDQHSLPDSFRPLSMNSNDTLCKKAIFYLKTVRRLDISKLQRKLWGYGTSGKYLGYIIIPFYYKNKLVYFHARRYMLDGPRYNNPNTDEVNMGKSFIWYNHDALTLYRTIYICEGVFNAETIGDQAIASGGKHISKFQINEIIKSQVEKVVICLDSDAKDKAIELALTLVQHKKVKLVFFPDSIDANDLGHKDTLKLVYSHRYLSYQDILKLKLNH